MTLILFLLHREKKRQRQVIIIYYIFGLWPLIKIQFLFPLTHQETFPLLTSPPKEVEVSKIVQTKKKIKEKS